MAVHDFGGTVNAVGDSAVVVLGVADPSLILTRNSPHTVKVSTTDAPKNIILPTDAVDGETFEISNISANAVNVPATAPATALATNQAGRFFWDATAAAWIRFGRWDLV